MRVVNKHIAAIYYGTDIIQPNEEFDVDETSYKAQYWLGRGVIEEVKKKAKKKPKEEKMAEPIEDEGDE